MNIAGLDKAVVLASLYNRSFQQGMGVLDKNGRQEMNVEQARKHLDLTHDFDYLNGRVMKIDLSSAEVDTWLYNRENGEGAAERIIEQIRASMPPEIKQSTNKPHFCHKHG